MTRKQLATFAGRTPDWVSKCIAEGMPTVTTGGGRGKATVLDLGEVLPWLLQRKTGSFDLARTRYYEAQAAKVELEHRRRLGELVDAADVARRFSDAGHHVKLRIRAVADRVVDRFLAEAQRGPHAIRALVLAELDEALRSLAATTAEVRHSDEEKGGTV